MSVTSVAGALVNFGLVKAKYDIFGVIGNWFILLLRYLNVLEQLSENIWGEKYDYKVI